MNSSLRMLFATLVAVPGLIDRDFENPEVSNSKIAELVQPDEEIKLDITSKKPDKVEEPEEPPPELEMASISLDMDVDIANAAPTATINVEIASSGMSSGDGEYLPIVKVAPIYPRRAQTRGTTGYCIVEYTVTKTGSIRDPVAIDCVPSGVFDRASVKASTKFKYKPRVVDGEPIEVAGVRNKFTYELEN
jgi:protein TonB